MAEEPRRGKPGQPRPQIWVAGGQRPPFDLRALARATLHLAREVAAPSMAWTARHTRRLAVNVSQGAGRIPEARLGRAARFVPSHLRVAGWIKTLSDSLAHASASADPDVRRGNALVAEIEPPLWDAAPAPQPEPTQPELPSVARPVVLAEPQPQADDPLSAIRGDIAGTTAPASPPPPFAPRPPGEKARAAIQISGYLLGWLATGLALPFGLVRALWLYAKGHDLRTIGAEA